MVLIWPVYERSHALIATLRPRQAWRTRASPALKPLMVTSVTWFAASTRTKISANAFISTKKADLLLRRVSAQRTLFGPLADSSDYSDYKEVQGVKVAFTVKRTTPETTFTRKIDAIEFNKPVGMVFRETGSTRRRIRR